MSSSAQTRLQYRRWDVVVVGRGHNALTAAGYLARAGRRVLVLERAGCVGGAAVSQEAFPGVPVRLSRYAYLVSLLPRQIVDDLGLDLRLARRRISSYTPDPAEPERGLLVADDPDATRRSFARMDATGDHAGWSACTPAPPASPGLCSPPSPGRCPPAPSRGSGWATTPCGQHWWSARSGRRSPSGCAATSCAAWPRQTDSSARSPGWTITGRWDVSYRERGEERTTHGDRVLAGVAPWVLERLCPGACPGPKPRGAQVKVNLLLHRLPAV